LYKACAQLRIMRTVLLAQTASPGLFRGPAMANEVGVCYRAAGDSVV
jgi:hypothetical protein